MDFAISPSGQGKNSGKKSSKVRSIAEKILLQCCFVPIAQQKGLKSWSGILFPAGSGLSLQRQGLRWDLAFGMQILDFFDFLTNSVMMPVAALITCVYLTRAVGIGAVEDEIMAGGAPFRRRALFRFMIRYVCPVFVLLILLSSVAEVMGWIKY